MTTYADYTTLTDVRATYINSTATGRDTLFSSLIRSTSREIEQASNRKFYPRVETRYFDTPDAGLGSLLFDDDLLALTTLTNGDGTAFTASDYKLYPLNATPKQFVKVLASSSLRWQTASGDPEGAISVAGVWGFHDDYGSAWLDIAGVLAAALNSSATSFTCTTGTVRVGDLLKIDSEYLYASAVSTSSTDTVTCVRGVNGSTATSHLISAPLYRWYYPAITALATVAVVAYERLQNNPLAETISIDGYNFATPKDVTKYIQSRLGVLGLIRLGLG